jgi:ankyrin repeat protein
MHWAARAGDPAVLDAVRAHSAAGDLSELTQPPRVTNRGGGNVERKLSGDVGVRLDTDVVPGQTPLHVAARNGRIRALRLMLRNERDLDALDQLDGAGCTPLAAAAGVGKHETVRAMAEELGLDAADGEDGADDEDARDAGGRRWDVEGAEGADDSSSNDDDDEAENGGVGDGRLEFSALEWAAYDGRADVVKAVVRTGGHAPRDYARAMRVAKTRRAKGPVLRLLSRGRE